MPGKKPSNSDAAWPLAFATMALVGAITDAHVRPPTQRDPTDDEMKALAHTVIKRYIAQADANRSRASRRHRLTRAKTGAPSTQQ